MSIVETSLIFVGIPAAVTAVVAALVYGRAAARTPRYRPGGAVAVRAGLVPAASRASGRCRACRPADRAAAARRAGARPALAGRVAEPVTASGGASGEW